MAHEGILIADDDVEHRHQCRTALEQAEFHVLEASSGTELVTLAQAHRPQLILVDLLLPGMDGFEAVTELRRYAATAAIPILYLSTLAPEEARSQGVSSFMMKPFERQDLIAAVQRAVKTSPSRTSRPPILVVDDERDIVEIVSDYLEDAGYRGIGAADGREALSAVEREKPVAIILDVKMPVLDGYDVIRWVKRHPVHRRIPIIILTATKVQRVTGGAPEGPAKLPTVPKPCDPAQLVKAVREALRGA